VLTLLDALDAAGLPVPIQDAVGVAIGDAPEVLLSNVKSLFTGAGVGVAAAMRIVGRLVSVFYKKRFMVLGLQCVMSCSLAPPLWAPCGRRAPRAVVATRRPRQLQRRPGGGRRRMPVPGSFLSEKHN
jgi:hypothetical protein